MGANRVGRHVFVLVHGAWHGGWCWRRVAERLRDAGHLVFTPTCTGLGERAHLLSRDITLDTFTRDVAALIEAEELEDVLLVGHSFGGLAISGVADVMPERVRALIFLDSLLVQPGENPTAGLTEELVAARRKAAEDSSRGLSLPVPPVAMFGITDASDAAWVERHLTPHPFSTYASTLNIDNPVGNGLPCLYISCTDPRYTFLDGVRTWASAQPGWRWAEIATSHDAMITAPEALTRLLLDEAAR